MKNVARWNLLFTKSKNTTITRLQKDFLVRDVCTIHCTMSGIIKILDVKRTLKCAVMIIFIYAYIHLCEIQRSFKKYIRPFFSWAACGWYHKSHVVVSRVDGPQCSRAKEIILHCMLLFLDNKIKNLIAVE